MDTTLEYPMIKGFDVDNRDKPGLHALHVRYALEELTVINDFRETMSDFSRVSASILVSSLMKEVRKEILRDSAWYEAAALIQAGVDLRPYLQERHEPLELTEELDESPFNPTYSIAIGDTLKDLPPGTYGITLSSMEGDKLVAELAPESPE